MKVFGLILFKFCAIVSCVGQESGWPTPGEADFPKVASHGTTFRKFIPKGFKLVSKVSGDLNRDSLPDMALYIKGTSSRFVTKREYWEYDTNPRVLLILVGDKGHKGLRLNEQNNVFIATPLSPVNSEPFQLMRIRDGILVLDFQLWQSAGSWAVENASYKFRFQDGKMLLIGLDRENYMRNSAETYIDSYNLLTGRVKSVEKLRTELDNPPKQYKPKTEWRRLPSLKPLSMADLGPAFSWQPESLSNEK